MSGRFASSRSADLQHFGSVMAAPDQSPWRTSMSGAFGSAYTIGLRTELHSPANDLLLGLGFGVKGFCQSVLDGVGLLIDELAADPMFADGPGLGSRPPFPSLPSSCSDVHAGQDKPRDSVNERHLMEVQQQPQRLGSQMRTGGNEGYEEFRQDFACLEGLFQTALFIPQPGELSDNRFVSARFVR